MRWWFPDQAPRWLWLAIAFTSIQCTASGMRSLWVHTHIRTTRSHHSDRTLQFAFGGLAQPWWYRREWCCVSKLPAEGSFCSRLDEYDVIRTGVTQCAEFPDVDFNILCIQRNLYVQYILCTTSCPTHEEPLQRAHGIHSPKT
jgi:hypothetical protein